MNIIVRDVFADRITQYIEQNRDAKNAIEPTEMPHTGGGTGSAGGDSR